MEALRSYSWPGNIRELKNVIERAEREDNLDTVQRAHIRRVLDSR